MRIWEKLKSDELLRHSALLFAGMIAVHVSNVIFQMVVGRVLPKEEYALLAAFLGILAIIQRPLSTLRTAICYHGSLLQQEGRRGDVKRLLRKWLGLTSIPSVAAALLAIIFSQTLAEFFHLDRSAPIIIGGALLPALCWMPILGGAAQGLQMFGWSSASAIIGALVRLGLGAGFTWFLYKACGWAMLGHGLSLYATAGVILVGLWMALHGRETSAEPLPSMRLYLFQSFFVLAAYAVLMTADVVMVKHYLPNDDQFAYAATLGRLVIFLPGAIVAAMFPKVASKGTLTRHQKKLFFQSLGYTAAFVTVSAAGCFVVPGLLARILFGIVDASAYLKQMIGAVSVVMALNALLNVVVQFLLAQRRFKVCIATVICACIYLVGTQMLHETSWHIVGIAGACNGAALLAGLIGMMSAKVED